MAFGVQRQSPMATLQNLIVWQLSDELLREVIRLTDNPPAARDFRFRDQIRAAAGSVPANIAEGYGRLRHLEFARFLDYASGSLQETEQWLRDGVHRNFWSAQDVAPAFLLCRRLNPAIRNLRRHLKNTKTPTLT